MFLKSIDASDYVKTSEKLFELLDDVVEKIGEHNVVQVVTDNWSNYVLAAMLRHFTNGKELVRHVVTRFATSFLSLKRLYEEKENLRRMFTSDEWAKNKLSNEAKGREATTIVIMPSFWNHVKYTLKIIGPLVRVLRLVDGEKKPPMRYIYEAMEKAKECVVKTFLNDESKLVPSQAVQQKILEEQALYKAGYGLFGSDFAKSQKKKISLAFWWRTYGHEAPNMQDLAIKILSLTCSASRCEHNWSIFEHIHTKKRNRLDHERMEILVFIKYNQQLIERYNLKDEVNPIALNDIDECNEWLVGEIRTTTFRDDSVDDDADLVHQDQDDNTLS
ncbi:uncharacterized protein [Arachis hypogaea]|uniref:uncharacterized protein n=1 Tax=Arachis hypogaea TaxID=3818 RepID=UPI000DEC47C2|nr:uncharacterized protein LOC112709575 [Arachis hypogaea]